MATKSEKFVSVRTVSENSHESGLHRLGGLCICGAHVFHGRADRAVPKGGEGIRRRVKPGLLPVCNDQGSRFINI